MGQNNNPMRPPTWGRCIVIAGNERGDRTRQFLTERGTVLGRAKTYLSVHRQRRQAFVSLACNVHELADFANNTSGESNEVTRREAVGGAARIRGNTAQGSRRDDVRFGRRDEQPLRQPAPAALLRDLRQAV